MIDQKTRKLMAAELEKFGMPSVEALERVNNIAQAIVLGGEVDKIQVSQMLCPRPHFLTGILDDDKRLEAASNCLAVYLLESGGSDIAIKTGLGMYCGMDKDEAIEYYNKNKIFPAGAGDRNKPG